VATVVPAVVEDTTSNTSASFTAPSGITGMQGLIVIGTGTSTSITISAASTGATFTKLDEQGAGSTRATLFKVTGLSPGATVNLTWPSGNNTVEIAQFYTDEHTIPSSIPSAGIRSSSQATTTTGAYTPAAGQRLLVVGVERTTSSTTVSGIESSDSESVTTVIYGEGATIQTSVLIARFDSDNATSHTATITYSNSSANGYAVLVPLTAVSGGGGGSGGGSTPALITSYLVTSSTNGTSSLVTSAFTPTNGEVIVVKASTSDAGTVVGTPTGGSQTYTLRGSVTSGSFCYAVLYTAIVAGSPGSMTITVPFSGDSGRRSMLVERWSNATLDATPAVNATKTGSGAPSATLTTEANNSVVSWVNADWNANAPGSRAYRSSATELGIHDQSAAADNQYVGYYAWQSTATAGSQTLGMTAPTGQAWSLVGVEVMGVPAPGTTPVVRASTSQGAATGTTSVSVPNPGVVAGDYVLCVHGGDSDSDPDALGITASGFTTLVTVAPTTAGEHSPAVKVYGKIASSADASAINFTFTDDSLDEGGSDAGAIVIAITVGTYDTANPVSLPVGTFTEQPRTTTTLQTAPSVTGAVNQLCLAIFASDINGTPSTAPFQDYPSSGPTGMTKVNSVRGSGNFFIAGVYSRALTSAGATGTRTVTPSNAGTENGWAAGQLLINSGAATTNVTSFFLAA
jgi:hypothetical protein